MEKILQANIYCLLLLFIYFTFLRTSTSYSWSRFYLLLSTSFALLLPFVSFEFSVISDQYGLSKMIVELPAATIKNNLNFDSYQNSNNWLHIVYWFYVAAALIYNVVQYFFFKAKLKSFDFIEHQGYKMYVNTGFGPGSFGKHIIVPSAEIDPQILQHEIAHIEQYHYYDKVFLRIITIFFPLVFPLYFIKKELSLIHELQADEYACDNKEQYALLLLNTQFQTQSVPYIQLFFHHPLKKRIMMLQKSKPLGKAQKFGLMASFLLVCSSLVVVQGCKQDAPPTVGAKVEPNETPVTSVLPTFPGGEEGLYQYLADVITYPEGEKNEGTVRVNFIVDKNGIVQSAKVIKPVAPRLDSTAIAVISKMPKWTPAKDASGNNVDMHFMLPIKFVLDK